MTTVNFYVCIDDNKENESTNEITVKLDKMSVVGDAKDSSNTESTADKKSATTTDDDKEASSGDK